MSEESEESILVTCNSQLELFKTKKILHVWIFLNNGNGPTVIQTFDVFYEQGTKHNMW